MTPDIFTGLRDEHRRLLLSRMPRRSFRSGDTLFHEGDLGDTLHLLQRGKVAVRVSTPLGDVVTLSVLGPGATFGELALLAEDATRTAAVVALEPVETRVLHRHDFVQLCRDEPSVERLLVHVMAQQVRRLSTLVVEAMYLPADRRVVRRIDELGAVYDVGARPIEVPVRQEDLATMAGTTRQTTNQVLRQLEADGVLTLGRARFAITRPDELAVRAR
jgi:CRP-like cAMP-binding protein